VNKKTHNVIDNKGEHKCEYYNSSALMFLELLITLLSSSQFSELMNYANSSISSLFLKLNKYFYPPAR